VAPPDLGDEFCSSLLKAGGVYGVKGTDKTPDTRTKIRHNICTPIIVNQKNVSRSSRGKDFLDQRKSGNYIYLTSEL
jgi:hypothetical protein